MNMEIKNKTNASLHTFLLSSKASLACVALMAWYAFLFFRRYSGTNLITLFDLITDGHTNAVFQK